MKNRAWFVSLAVLLMAAAMVMAADDPFLGTWNLNEGKSKITGKAKNTKVVYESAGDSVKVTVEGVDSDGKAVHTEWTGKFDGKEAPVTGGAAGDVRAYKKVGARALSFTDKVGGKLALSGKITLSADGKTRTVAVSVKDMDGKAMTNTYVYDKE